MAKHILDVPYYSQHIDVLDESWQSRACGVICLKMVMDFYNLKSGRVIISADDLIKEGAYIEGNLPAYGWSHNHLVLLARNHGFMAYPQEFRSHKIDYANKKEEVSEYEEALIDKGIEKIISSLENGHPVIVSIFKNFEIGDKFHMVLLTGFESGRGEVKGFYYHDPDSVDKEEGKHRFVPTETFKKYWRKMAIYVNI
ncbi:MAG: C39 family peptidase [Parcubacteria group bacterium]|nr:C39 family peptidase [Parcubacteria group bacterium]MCR4342390.1 C39 family peptidase [Patescibacteria group bacterium]